MINCKPYGGISNRLKCMISSIVEYGQINLIWDIPNSGGGVWCDFNDIFKNEFIGKSKKVVSDCKFIHENMNTHNFGGKENIDEILKAKYIEVIKKLEPVDYVKIRVSEELKYLDDFTTFSVRTFRSFKNEFNSWGRRFDIDKLFHHMDNVDGKILFTCDDYETTEKVKNRFNVYTTKKRTTFGDFKSVEGMQDILIDQYLGSKSKKLYGTNMSSFSELQWWLGECKQEYIGMSLHKPR